MTTTIKPTAKQEVACIEARIAVINITLDGLHRQRARLLGLASIADTDIRHFDEQPGADAPWAIHFHQLTNPTRSL